jgi:[protein-PII] uridylyltransferase
MVKSSIVLKKKFEKETKDIVQLHRAGSGGIAVALALTHRLDKLLQTVFQHIDQETQHLAIVALGGYGRKELNFSSDTDIMFLIADEEKRHLVTPAVQEFLHTLLDLGLDVGHSFRTIDECIALPEEDFESRISLIESRYICGDQVLYREFISVLQKKIKTDNYSTFVQQIAERQQVRYQKYGNSSKLLEPNIKNSAGGLRDIHTALWLMRGTGIIRISSILGSTETAILHLLKSTVLRQQFTPAILKEVHRSFDVLLRVRNEMHIQSRSLHDTLEFAFQPHIASQLRYRARSKRTNVERFMQDYYTASRSVALFCSRILNWTNDKQQSSSPEVKSSKLQGAFILRSKRIHTAKKSTPISNELLLRALLLRSERHADFSFQLEDRIHRRLQFIKPLSSQIETDLFRLLLHRPNGVGNSLRKINELGLLDRWIPEWRPMVSFFQHNQYHFYTADEHTMAVITNAELLEQSNSLFGVVFRSLPRRDTLYLSCLLHDIAKPLQIGKHELKGVPIAKRVLHRLRYDDLIEDVTFLVRHHLLMEQVAFRRNLNDPQTIADFARTFDRIEQLDFLFILTFADLSAVNRNVWTEWKELLLTDLYRKTHTVLEEEMTREQIYERTVQQGEQKKADIFQSLIPEFPPEEVEEHLALLSDTSYLSAFKLEEMTSHLLSIRRGERVTTLFKQIGNYTEVTFITHDAPGLLSKLCGVLTANDANILDAQVFTRRDGMIIDKFRVVEFISQHALSIETCDRVSRDIKEVISGRVDIAHLIERHRMRWKRRTQPVNPNIRRDVEFEDHPQFTIIDIYAPDALGFLYRITEAISLLDLNITFAKIATRVDGIVDSFYLLDNSGKKMEDLGQREKLRSEILSVIQKVYESELVATSINS